jgi:hypothetical protein
MLVVRSTQTLTTLAAADALVAGSAAKTVPIRAAPERAAGTLRLSIESDSFHARWAAWTAGQNAN